MAAAVRRTLARASSHRSSSTGFGCGIDVVELPRFAQALQRGGQAFLNRIFTTTEQRYARRHRDPLPHLAARFAAKEAVIKAISQAAPGSLLSMKAIEIRNAANGRPSVTLHARARHVVELQISLSHSEGLAMACAVAILA